MSERVEELLQKDVKYSGEGISVRSLEDSIGEERNKQDVQVETLKKLRTRNVEIQEALETEVKQLRKLSDYVASGQSAGSFWTSFKEILSYIPGLGNLAITRRSIEELLRQQYEISTRRVKEAAEFADRLAGAESDLHDEIDRLNQKIIDAAKNEEVAAEHVLELEEAKSDVSAELAAVEEGSAESRELQRDLDRLKRLLAEHSTNLQLYHTAESRLNRLKESTRMLADTIGNLRTDITQYVNAASEKLDLVSGQIRAIGTAADASVVMLEMKKSLDSMTESLNQTTHFVSETQLYFRNNVDNLIKDLEIFDEETRATLEQNLELSKAMEEERIAAAVKVALEKRAEKAADAG